MKHFLRGAVISAAIAATFGMSTPAIADVSKDGCTVKAERPYADGTNSQNLPLVRYDLVITCDKERTIHITQEAWEQDNGQPGDSGGDNLIRSKVYPPIVFEAGGTKTRQLKYKLSNYDSGGDSWNEVYQRVKFYVKSGGVTGSLSQWDKSAVRNIHV